MYGPVYWFTYVYHRPYDRFSDICYGVSETLPASKLAHINQLSAVLFTPEIFRLHFSSQLKN